MPEDKEYSYEVVREGSDVILKVNYENVLSPPSIEEDPVCMSRTINMLLEAGKVTKLIFQQKRDFEYDFDQVQIIQEIASLYNKFVKNRDLMTFLLAKDNPASKSRQALLQKFVYSIMKKDPLGAYVLIRRERREQEHILESDPNNLDKETIQEFARVLDHMLDEFEATALIKLAQPYVMGYKLGDRSIYKKLFHPTIKPDFMFTKLMASYPQEGEVLANYSIANTDVTIFELPGSVNYLYHIVPPEFKLTEAKYDLLDTARSIMAEHKPTRSEFVNPALMREVFYNVGHDLIEELANKQDVRLRLKEIDELAEILVRYTVGFGLIEILLNDPQIQDISINSPMGNISMFIVHGEFGDCKTNIIPTASDGESWATKLRLMSGRPLDEANPILDTELELPTVRARIAVISPPLNPSGLAYSWRRHRIKPWTLPLFIKYKMMNPLAAGLMSFIVDGARTILVAGTRSAGKTSLLGSLMVELMRRTRIITVEDTLELPSDALRKFGYNIQPLKVAAALSKGSSEVPADEGIRSTLRLGDSALFVGEVRSTEAKALYEAMRVGALANVVAGTIHADSPYGIYDRVVNDLGVPKTSFKATDIALVANPIRSPDGIHRWRRVTQITEVRKFWEEDPLRENGFADLMKYDATTDELQESEVLINGESEILKAIAGNVKEWAGNWDAVWDNVLLRTKIKERVVKAAAQTGDDNLLEAGFVIVANDEFHKISERVREEVGALDSDRIYFEWESWLKTALTKKKFL
ncbi:CpaF family protein [Candidatus Woesearchaeota archaeon]|jgi:archaeal flagellar protein FlaI|nr:CpaF family protein [Candidatus Woesearchaeota archaeon]MBT4368598.1 CpaF family protein [Candidatus Woesearchaeota archaeon]MBT4713093.1 CpaF family protein [Candidatus Woesearchaeota archaeon]MBT6639015.1 CpaF family protein [Candidatus Woesearchaeota archaeon]MBT7134214.1 CpaF family protein [Candidatus Woesearchaeota archaeon]